MADNTKSEPDLNELIIQLSQSGHAFHAIWMAAILEDRLKSLLVTTMPNLSNRLEARLFEGYGPLSSFSAKIDVGYAMDLIPSALRKDLHVIREIRNEFAHPKEKLHLDTDEMHKLLKKFTDYDPKMDRLEFYVEKFKICIEAIDPAMNRMALAALLRDGSGPKA